MLNKALAALAAISLLAGCDINGNDSTYPGASVFEASDKAFHFHYLAPPWRGGKPIKGALIHLLIDGFTEHEWKAEPITYDLQVAYVAGTSAAQAAAARAVSAVKVDKRTVSKEVAQVTSLTGEQGWEFHSHKSGFNYRVFYRDTFFADKNGKVVHFAMIGVFALEEQDIDDLLLSFSADADDGSEVPPRRPDAGPDLGQVADASPEVKP